MSHIEGGACVGETLRAFAEERRCRARALVIVDGSVDLRCAPENFTFFQPRISASEPAPNHLALYGDFNHVRIRSEDHQGFPVHFWGNATSLEVNGSAGFFAVGNVAHVRAGAAHLAGTFGEVIADFGLEGQGNFGNITTSAELVHLAARPIGQATYTFYGSKVRLRLEEPPAFGIDIYLAPGWDYFDGLDLDLSRMNPDHSGPQHFRYPQPTAGSDHLTVLGLSPRGVPRGEVSLYKA